MNTRYNPVLAAQRNIQARQVNVPRGAQQGVIAGQQPQGQGQAMQRQPQRQAQGAPMGMQISPAIQAKINAMQGMQVPQGAQAGNIAGCGDGGCMDVPYGAPFQQFVNMNAIGGQNAALLGVRVPFTDASGTPVATVTVQAACGNTQFYGCCVRTFNGANEVLWTSVYAGASNVNLLCEGSPIDLSYFNTNGNQCCCEFDIGCFSQFFPLIMSFDAIGAPSVTPPVNMVIGGQRLWGGDACTFWPGLAPGFGGGVPLPA